MNPRNLFRLAAASLAVSGIWVGINLGKPFTIDDPVFIYWARTISPLPGDAPMEYINWESFDEPLVRQLRPLAPGWSILVSRARRLAGDGEAVLHLLQWPFAAMFLAGSGLLAARLGVSVPAVFMLCATSPLFLLPTASAMVDMACAGPGVLGLAIWMGAGSWPALLAGGLLVALAGQMKQTIIPLLPLLFLLPSGAPVRNWRVVAAALATCLLAGTYPDVPPRDSTEQNMLANVFGILLWSEGRGFLFPKAGYALASCSALLVFPAAFAAALALRRPEGIKAFHRTRLLATAAAALLVLRYMGLWREAVYPNGRAPMVHGGFEALWFAASMAVFLAWMADLLWKGWAAGRLPRWLLAWMALTFVGGVAGTPFPAARFMIFMLPPLAVLLAGSLAGGAGRKLLLAAVAGNLWLGGGLAASDYAFASCGRDLAAQAASVAKARGLPLWTTGQWGMRLYVERAGGTVLGSAREKMGRGAVVLHPRLTDHRVLPANLVARIDGAEVVTCGTGGWHRALGFLPRTIPSPVKSASFHGGNVWIPYAFSRGPAETACILVITPQGRKGALRRLPPMSEEGPDELEPGTETRGIRKGI